MIVILTLTMLEVCHLTASYRNHLALHDVSFVLHPGQVTNLLGPNGAGKSTVLKALLGLIPLRSGAVFWHKTPLRQHLRRVAYVPQRSAIDWDYPITVENVVRLGRVRQTGWFRDLSPGAKAIARHALERVGMADHGRHSIGELSGGQQQRVFIARALAQEADIFFFDEPFTGIDPQTEAVLFDVFAQLKSEGKTLLVISHDLGSHLAHYDQFLLLNQTLIAAGSQKEVMCPDCLERAYGKGFFLRAA